MLFKQKHRFSIRKFSFGVCSALLGTALIMGADSASASETDASAETQAADTSSDTSTDPDSAATATTSETDSEPVATTATETSEPAADTTADQTETAATETTESTTEPATTEAASETNSTEATPTETASEPTTEEKAATETSEPATTETTTKVSAPTREEAFPNEGESIPTGTYFRAPLEAVAQTAPTGTQVTPEVTVVSSHEGLSETPTITNKPGTSIKFSFGDQPLHQGDYFYVETQDVPIALPRTFRLKSTTTDGEGPVIATVERVSYESDFVKGTDSTDSSRFNLKNDSSLTTMAIKYKVTFTDAVEGLKDVSATVSGNTSKQTLATTVERPTEFKVKINDKTVYTSVYTEPVWDGANAQHYQRSPYNTGYESVITEGLLVTEIEIVSNMIQVIEQHHMLLLVWKRQFMTIVQIHRDQMLDS
ncbi:MAG: YSIRK-type signal peptide-containing protein [Staphylococcus rostri]|uniref:YSIRK-type signal peptide-containing protein n=1 Tax=Staphylococcus rostri TaxID=522262 RepID=UPI0026E09B88|nr:YSIRK-type signal peptide-containing protein [Staphylococcus rostri]MDO5376601.1 YSIRK-type signal peptide-containing protein [Staphylococcus rostri]